MLRLKTIGVYEAKTQLPRLLVRVARGERITIMNTRHGVPVAMIVPTESRFVLDCLVAMA